MQERCYGQQHTHNINMRMTQFAFDSVFGTCCDLQRMCRSQLEAEVVKTLLVPLLGSARP